MKRSTGVATRMLFVLVIGCGSQFTGSAAPATAADEPREEPVQTLQATGETRVVNDQTGTQVWAVVDGWDLDQYLFRAGSPLKFAIDVDRDFGPVDSEGHPVPGNLLFGLTGRISVRVFDVDDDAPSTPEVDHLFLNGELLGTLSGANNQWSINTFEFPLNILRLPTAGNPDGRNDFHVDIDTTNSGWAVEVDWAELRLKEDFRPLAMVHGYTSSGETWDTFKEYVDQNAALDADDIITPTHSSTNFETSVGEIEPRIDELLIAAGAHHLDIVSHSMGGLISRLYAWDNPSRVDKLIMIGTPNGGTELADAFCLLADAGPFASGIWVGQLFDEQFGPCAGPEDAAFQLQTEYVRNVFNVQVRDREGTEYWVIGGAIPEDADRPWGLDPFPSADDGIVPLDSAQYLLIGRPDHPGKHRLLETLPLEHGALISEGSEAMPLSVCELYSEQCAAQSASLLQPQAAEPSDQVIRQIDGTQVAPGGNGIVDLEFEGADSATVVLISDHLADITPSLSGATFVPGKLLETDVLVAELESPADGQLHIANGSVETTGVVAFVGVPAGRRLDVAPSEILGVPGLPVDIAISLTEASAGEIAAAQVFAPSGAISTVSLTATATGAWTGSFAPTESGVHSIAAWVEGSRPRFDTTVFTVSSGVAQLTGPFAERLEGAEDGLADTLVIAPEVVVSAAGRYRLAADLADSSGSVIASAGVVADLAVGTSNVDLAFSGRAIFDAGVDGPYDIVNVALSRDDAGLTLEDHVDELGSTAPYVHSAFDHFPVLFDLESFSDAGVDANSDEVFESLNISFSVSVEQAGSYAVNARLLGPDGTEIAETQSTPTLVSGSNEVELVFDAEAIAASALDGPYKVADLSVYPLANADVLGYLVTAHQTQPYSVAAFGGAGSIVTERVSESSQHGQGNGLSHEAYMSADGRYVTFESEASDLVSGDTNATADVFVRDRLSDTTSRVSVASDGTQANGSSEDPTISPDGRYVAFRSNATNLVSGDTNNKYDIFVHDRQTGTTTRVSVTNSGAQATGASDSPVVARDGAAVVFRSFASNLVSGDTNGETDIFVRDLVAGSTTRVSVSSAGAQGNAGTDGPTISDDGRFVAFDSTASTLVAGDTNAVSDVFLRDRATGTTSRVSVAAGGTQANAASWEASLDADGSTLAFQSGASNLVAGDTNAKDDAFVVTVASGAIVRASVGDDEAQSNNHAGEVSLSADGTLLAFYSSASNLVAGDTNGKGDIFVRDLVNGTTTRWSVATDGAEGNDRSTNPTIAGAGHTVAFHSFATNLVANDTNAVADVFVRGPDQ